MIQVNGLVKDYGARRALHSITFDANQGEIVGFLGPNGAGKTTTMRILSGYMPPTDGTAIVAGYDIVEESLEVRKRVGYLPETVPLYTDMTALEYLKFMADLRHIPNSEARAYETLEQVNLKDRASHKPGEMSGGQQQRVGIARAIVADPPLLLCVEPTGDLDRATADEILSLLQQLNRQHNKTILMVTHDPKAADHASRQLEMDKGQLIERALVTA